MYRIVVVLCSFVLLVLALPGSAWSYSGDPLVRGPGFYVAWYKLLLCWLLFLTWVKTTDWVNRDVQQVGEEVGLPAKVWNPVVVFTFLGGFLFLLLPIPIFAVGYLLLVVCHVAPLTTYILQRNARVADNQKVLTRDHLKRWFASLGSQKEQAEAKMAWEMGPPVNLNALGSTDQENQANLIMARQSPGFVTLKELLADAVDKWADRIMLDYSKESVAVRYEIDGVWHNVAARERESGDLLLAVAKKLAALNMTERRARQQGQFAAQYQGGKYTCNLTSQGTQGGERAVLHLVAKGDKFKTLEELGMRDKMRDQLKGLLGASSGLFLFSSPPAGGLSTTWKIGLASTDRLLRDFVCLEDRAKPETQVENIELIPYDAAAGQTPDQMLASIMRKQPDALVLPELPNAETVKLLCQQVTGDNKLVVASVRAKEAVEALLRVLLLKAPAPEFAKAVTGVLNQRLVRKLCERCKQAYEPAPQLLKKLGIPPGRIQALYREWQPPPPGEEPKKKKDEPEVCPECNGIGYRERTAIYELLVVDDKLRQALVKQPKLEVLRQVARQNGHRTLQEEGIALVARGVTSLAELQRVMK